MFFNFYVRFELLKLETLFFKRGDKNVFTEMS